VYSSQFHSYSSIDRRIQDLFCAFSIRFIRLRLTLLTSQEQQLQYALTMAYSIVALVCLDGNTQLESSRDWQVACGLWLNEIWARSFLT